ncbi:MAG: cytochrome c oxidase subunit II [Dehalococcoidia bacterium]
MLLSLITATSAFADASGQPAGITEEAGDMHNLYLLVLGMALVVFVLVEAALIFIIFRFRKQSDALPPQTHGNNALEIIWTSIPIVIVLILFVFSFVVLVRVDDKAKAEDLTVEVQGFQFCWSFTYHLNDLGRGGDKNATGNVVETQPNCEAVEPVLVIPVNEPVEFKLKSTDVIHSFYVRDFLYKLDVVPGRDNSFQVTANETGTFEGQCAELCGANHALMRFRLRVVERSEFDTFISERAAASKAAAAAVKD